MNHSFSSTDAAADDALAAYGWTQSVSARYEPFAGPGLLPVRVVRVDRGSCLVATREGITDCRLGALEHPPVTGDWGVAGIAADGGLVLERLLARTSTVLRRNAAASGEQVLVANVDHMFVLHGIDRPHRVGRMERLAILSWDAGVPPVIVLTKIDLKPSDGAVIGVDEAIAEIQKVIHDIEVVATSSVTGAGFADLQRYLGPGQTVGVVGESGAGKSSLVNYLAGETLQSTGETREGDHKGRHTTTSRDLVPLPGGAVLVDTPGLRSVSMPVAEDGLVRSYGDLEALFAECRFRDCTHEAEPGCGIQMALADGVLTEERWAGYQKLQKEIAIEAKRVADRGRREEARSSRKRRKTNRDVADW